MSDFLLCLGGFLLGVSCGILLALWLESRGVPRW